jgi:hypothetical protein
MEWLCLERLVCVYSEFACGEHVEVGVDVVVVKGDEEMCPWGGSIIGTDEGGDGSVAVVDGCQRSRAGGGRTYCVVQM